MFSSNNYLNSGCKIIKDKVYVPVTHSENYGKLQLLEFGIIILSFVPYGLLEQVAEYSTAYFASCLKNLKRYTLSLSIACRNFTCQHVKLYPFKKEPLKAQKILDIEVSS